jgi:hypothetical protein
MTTNPLERAVIEAARSAMKNPANDLVALQRAIDALESWEATQDPEVREIGWHEVAEGDQLKSVKTGKFYPVLGTLKVRAGYRITIQVTPGAGGTKQITRPAPDEPSAFVKRGQAGTAVDIFVNVFSSGEVK